MYGNKLENLVGKKVVRVFMNENNLRFDTDGGVFCFSVDGDCCSLSYFYDFYGVKNLFENGKIIAIKEVELKPSDTAQGKYGEEDKKGSDSISVYGFQITTESKDLGERTSVFSFRNYSNGYYGGSLEDCSEIEVSPEIKDDVICTEQIK